MKNEADKSTSLVFEIQTILDEGVQMGHFECDDTGRYRMTKEGRRFYAQLSVWEMLNAQPGTAHTFGALVEGTGLDPEWVVEALVSLVNDGAIKMGEVNHNPLDAIFYVDIGQEKMMAVCAQDESAHNLRFPEHVMRIIDLVEWAGNEGGRNG